MVCIESALIWHNDLCSVCSLGYWANSFVVIERGAVL